MFPPWFHSSKSNIRSISIESPLLQFPDYETILLQFHMLQANFNQNTECIKLLDQSLLECKPFDSGTKVSCILGT